MIIIAEVSELTRKIKLPTDRVISVNGDYQVDGIALKLPATYEGDFDFSTAAVRVHWTGVDKVEHTNLLTDKDTSGRPLWIMPSELTQGGHGVIEFAISFVATDETAAVTKRWISDPVSFRNRRTVNGSNEDEEAEEETTYDRLASAIADVRAAQAEVEDTNAVLSSLTGSAPVPVENKSDMVDDGHLYLYTGDETGLVTGNLYYYVNGTLTNGGKYGSMDLDSTLQDDAKAAPAGVVGRELTGIKEDLSAITVDEEPVYITGWEQGSLSGDGGAEIVGTTRCRTIDYILASDLSVSPTPTLTVKAGYKVSLREYTRMSVAAYVGGSSWLEGENTIELVKGHYYKFVSIKTTTGTYKPEDVPEDVATITTGVHTDVSLTQYGKAADAGATGDILRNQNLDIVKRNGYVDTIAKLQQLKRPTRIASRELGVEPLSLLWFSDIHGDQRCLQNVMDFYNYYSDSIDGILHTGDSVTSKSENGMDFWNNVSGTEIILNTIGNHDTRVGDVWIGQTMAESYTEYFAPYIANWGANYTEGLTYYYKDYATPGIRLIILDCMHQTAEQLTWFADVLTSAKSAGYHVLVAVHGRPHWLFNPYDTPWDDAPVVPHYGDEGYTDKSGTSYPENLSDGYASAVDDFIADGGVFIAWLHGHMHLKMFAMLETHPSQLDVSVANAGGTDFAWTYVWARIPDTRSEDDFNVLAVDTVSKVLRIAKFGVNYDRYMRHVDTISYDYGNRTLIYSN